MHQVTRQVEVKPAVAEGPGLEARRVGHGHQRGAPETAEPRGRSRRRDAGDSSAGTTARWPAALVEARRCVGVTRRRGSARAQRSTASCPRAASASSRLPSPAPTSSTGPSGAIRSSRPRNRPRDHVSRGVARAGEPARIRAIPRVGASRASGSGQGSVVAAPHAAQRVRPASLAADGPRGPSHQTQFAGGSPSVAIGPHCSSAREGAD